MGVLTTVKFESQDITTTGQISGKDLILTDTTPVINLIDSTANPDYQINNTNGVFNIRDTTNTTDRFVIDSSGRLVVGHTTSIGEDRRVQVIGTTADTSSIQLIRHSADAGPSILDFAKSRNATIGSSTVVQDDDSLGKINFRGDDGTDLNSEAAQIASFIDGTPGSNDMPGRLVFGTTADGANSTTDRVVIDSRGQVGLGNGAAALPPTGNNNRVRIIHGFDHGVDGTTFQSNAHLVLQNNNSGISGTGPGGGDYSLGVLTLNGTHSNGSVRGTKICGAEKLSIYVNDQEDALDEPTILMDKNWVQVTGSGNNREFFFDTYTGNGDQALLWIANDGHRVDGGQTNGRGTFMVDGSGRMWCKSPLYLGRTRNVSGTTNHYENIGTGIQIYHGDSADSTQYCQRLSITPYSGSDVGDYNIIGWWTNSGTTGQVNVADQASNNHLKLSIKADGRVQGAGHMWCGRVEGSDASPISVYSSTDNSVAAYSDNAEGRCYIQGFAEPSSSNYSIFAETGTSTSDDDVQFKVRADNGRVYSDYGSSMDHGADYAEYFEWKDGNPSNEDRVGKTVVLEGDKIRLATNSDDKSKIIGIISGAPAVVGDAGEMKWHGRWLQDDFGRYITDDVELLVWNRDKRAFQPEQSDTFHLKQCDSSIRVSKIEEGLKDGRVPQWAVDQNLRLMSQERKKNPAYDPKKGYIPREDRKEWDAVGLVGKLYVYKDQPKGTNWIKLSDKTSTIERWLVR